LVLTLSTGYFRSSVNYSFSHVYRSSVNYSLSHVYIGI